MEGERRNYMEQYVVTIDDTLSKIAWKHRVRLDDLVNANKILTYRKYIYPGEKLFIPEPIFEKRVEEKEGECIKEFSYSDLEQYVNKWKNIEVQVPINITTIGKSVLNKSLFLITIGAGEKEVFYSGGWHANEWMTSKFLVEWTDKLIRCLQSGERFFGEDLSQIFNKMTLFVVPMVNPDGISLVLQGNYPSHPYYELIDKINKRGSTFDHWSANIRGVDLNHQWPASWEVEAEESPQEPWPRHYSGTAPLTEPEAIAIYSLTMRKNFAYVLAFHSQGQLIYWGYRGLEPKSSKRMVERLSLKSSYVPVHTADSDGGYKDWFIQETGRPGFTIEVGIGTNPLPFQAYGEIWSNNVLLALEGLLL